MEKREIENLIRTHRNILLDKTASLNDAAALNPDPLSIYTCMEAAKALGGVKALTTLLEDIATRE